VVQPAEIEAALMASEEQARKIDDVLAALRRDLEAARYSARRAQKQYDGADPENRLVTDELERRWNQALQRVRELESQIQQHLEGHGQFAVPTREDFADLAADLESVWNDPETDVRLKKRIVRTLIRDLIVDVDAQAGEMSTKTYSSWKVAVTVTKKSQARIALACAGMSPSADHHAAGPAGALACTSSRCEGRRGCRA
jgi:hypothetical protein